MGHFYLCDSSVEIFHGSGSQHSKIRYSSGCFCFPVLFFQTLSLACFNSSISLDSFQCSCHSVCTITIVLVYEFGIHFSMVPLFVPSVPFKPAVQFPFVRYFIQLCTLKQSSFVVSSAPMFSLICVCFRSAWFCLSLLSFLFPLITDSVCPFLPHIRCGVLNLEKQRQPF